MKAAQSYTVYQLTPDILDEVIDRKLAKLALRSFLNRFENVLVGTADVAHIHNVNERTVLAYIKDGSIVPEEKVSEKDHHRFRLSYALTLDFRELRKGLRAKTRV